MKEPNPEVIVELLNEGMVLCQELLKEGSQRIDLFLHRDAEVIEQAISRDQKLLNELRIWRRKLEQALPTGSLSQFVEQIPDSLRSKIEGPLESLLGLIRDLRCSNVPNFQYIQRSLHFTQGLLQAILGDTPTYDVAGQPQTSGGLDYRRVTLQL